MKQRYHLRYASLLMIILVILLTVSPLWAQNTPALNQTAEVTSTEGQILTVRYPKGWVMTTEENTLLLASDTAALEALSSGGIADPNSAGIIFYMSPWLDQMSVSRTLAPEETMAAFLEAAGLVGEIQNFSGTTMPMAGGILTFADDPNAGGFLAALGFPNGTIIVAAEPSEAIDATVLAIIDSATLTDGESVSTSISEDEPETGATVISVEQEDGSFDLSFVLPDGWEYEYAARAQVVAIGNTASALRQVSRGSPEFEADEVGITIGLPSVLSRFDVSANAAPKDTIQAFIDFTGATGRVATDASFSVPAARATLSGDPSVTSDIYALQFPDGTLIIGMQPPGMIDDTVLELLQSISYAESSTDTVETLTAGEEIRQWAVRANGSSQYGETSWSFAQATGEPDTFECGDNRTAWAAASSTGEEILVLHFEQAVIPTEINIHQTFNPGAIVRLEVGDTGNLSQVFTLPNSADPPGNTACPGIFSVDASGVNAPVNFVAIYLDQSITENWNEIDAVELVGTSAE